LTIRLPLPKSAARILREALTDKGIVLGEGQALDIVARLYGYNSWYRMQQDPKAQKRSALTPTGDAEFVLRKSSLAHGCCIHVGNVTVAISGSGAGVSVSLRPRYQPDARPLSTAWAEYAEAEKDQLSPDPTKPFYGCGLPSVITAIEFVSSDARALEWSKRVDAQHFSDGMLEWLEEGMPNDSYDLSEEVFRYDDGDHSMEVSGEELVTAKLDSDGRFTLLDGREFYLIDENHLRWAPTKRT